MGTLIKKTFIKKIFRYPGVLPIYDEQHLLKSLVGTVYEFTISLH